MNGRYAMCDLHLQPAHTQNAFLCLSLQNQDNEYLFAYFHFIIFIRLHGACSSRCSWNSELLRKHTNTHKNNRRHKWWSLINYKDIFSNGENKNPTYLDLKCLPTECTDNSNSVRIWPMPEKGLTTTHPEKEGDRERDRKSHIERALDSTVEKSAIQTRNN